MTKDQLPTKPPVPPEQHQVTYGSYLKVTDLLRLQQELSEPAEHDEMLFIVIHQVYELWFKQILHEVNLAEKALQAGELIPFVRTAKRINTIQQTLTQQVDILETMTPVDFNLFRQRLNPASGFQSYQFRLLEFRLGSRERSYLKFYRNEPDSVALLTRALEEPSLYDHFLHMMAKKGLAIPQEVLERDVSQPYEQNVGVRDAILKIYRQSRDYYDLYLALETLMDMDQGIVLWRYRHVAMVERMIGGLQGTGGSSGAQYLKTTLSKRFFPELWDSRNYLADKPYGGGKAP